MSPTITEYEITWSTAKVGPSLNSHHYFCLFSRNLGVSGVQEEREDEQRKGEGEGGIEEEKGTGFLTFWMGDQPPEWIGGQLGRSLVLMTVIFFGENFASKRYVFQLFQGFFY